MKRWILDLAAVAVLVPLGLAMGGCRNDSQSYGSAAKATYACPKCGMTSEKPGDCPGCKVPLKKKTEGSGREGS